MKTESLLLIIAAMLLLTGCDTDPEPVQPVALTVAVRDAGYSSRTAEAGLTTVFTPGDRIGVYAIRDGAIFEAIDNVCLRAEASGDSLVWIAETGRQLPCTERVSYHAYYPYCPTLPARLLLTPESDCFSYIAAAWRPAADQSDYASYTASDLMTARGTVTGGSLEFEMTHRMARVEVTFPSRAVEIGFDHGLQPLHEGTAWIMLVNPADPDLRLSGYYTDGAGRHRWSIPSGQRPGTANYYAVDP